ncbi:5'/3'-nucleotidase SurE [bacterium]|nr:5'/3'-nucleotidase SurE [bacterium]
MRILITNDDGIFAPGLLALVRVLRDDYSLTIVAPDSERSAVSHGLTIRTPLFVEESDILNMKGYAVSGTPADCVKLGIDQLVPGGLPDLVISGINSGANTGINVFYSGTVAGALEATFVNVPAIAISINSFNPENYSSAARIAAELVGRFKHDAFPGNVVLNVNVPDVGFDAIKGIRICRQSKTGFKDRYIRRESPGGQAYFWLNGDNLKQTRNIDLDDYALKENWVSVTPLSADFNANDGVFMETDQWLKMEDLPIKPCLLR